MKLNGFVGKGSGKLGASVFAISGGEQIVREYNPVVANPNTEAQIAQRAKLKLMSQLAAALASGLGFKKQGLVSARNQFVSKNIGLASYEANNATCDVTKLQLAPGTVAIPEVSVSSASAGAWDAAISTPLPEAVTKVVFVVARRTEDEKLVIEDVNIVDKAPAGTAATHGTGVSGADYIVFAYGWIPSAAGNNGFYGDYIVEDDAFVAGLNAELKQMLRSGITTKTSSGAATLA